MSRLQSAAKPYLLPLIRGEWPKLDIGARRIVAAWCTMFTMVIEFADPATQVTPQSERDYLRTRAEPPPNWIVWLGRALPGDIWDGAWNHFGLSGLLEINRQTGAERIVFPPQEQSTATIADALYLQTYSSLREELRPSAESFAAEHGLAVVWPISAASNPVLTEPSVVLTALAADSASRAFVSPGMPVRFAWEGIDG